MVDYKKMRYIALLRGINVGGNTMIKMAELKAAFEKECGFENVVTYINSGNIAFDCTSPRVSKGESSNLDLPALAYTQAFATFA